MGVETDANRRDQFRFRGLHPGISLGTASDRYAGHRTVIRLITPLYLRYEESYGRAFPFVALVEGMTSLRMIPDTVDLIQAAIARGQQVNIIVNNSAGGNAPLIAGEVARAFGQRQAATVL